METPYVHGEVQTEFSCVKYRLNVIFKFLFSLVSIIPPFLHTYLHLNTVLIRRTRWRSLGTYKWSSILSVVGEHRTEKYFHISDSKVIMQFYDIKYFQLIKWKLFYVWPDIFYHFWAHLRGGGMWKLLIRSWFLWCLKSHIHESVSQQSINVSKNLKSFFCLALQITLVNMLNAYMAI